MKTALYGRVVFGASAVLLGVIALLWHDADTWQTLVQIWTLPFGTIIGGCLMILQIAGGIGMQYPGTARWAAIVLGIVYLLFSMACVPGIIAEPAAYEHYGSFFEQFSDSVAPLPCAPRVRRMRHGRKRSAGWRASESESARFHLP